MSFNVLSLLILSNMKQWICTLYYIINDSQRASRQSGHSDGNPDVAIHSLPFQHRVLGEDRRPRQKVAQRHSKSIVTQAFLTSHRIIFVSANPTPDFCSFDIPIATLYKESVEFPLFGNTYLKGSTPPNQNLLPGHCHFKLWFMKGGCDSFIRNLDRQIKEVRKFNGNMEAFTMNSGMYSDMRDGKFQHQAFVDPNDPSQIFMQQPK